MKATRSLFFHSGRQMKAKSWKAVMEEAFLDVTWLIGAVISAHTGVGCLEIQYIRKEMLKVPGAPFIQAETVEPGRGDTVF